MSQIYLPDTTFENNWRALSLDEMKAQPAFPAVLKYYQDKGGVAPTFGQYLEADGRTVVTFIFTDSSDPNNVVSLEAADAICSAQYALNDLRRRGISKTSVASNDPFNWTPPADPAVPPPPTKIVPPVYIVGESYDGGKSYMNMGPIPYVGAKTTDARGEFVAEGHATIGGVTFYWVLKNPAAPVSVAPVNTSPSLMALLALPPDQITQLMALAKMLGLLK
jgi:hypothetical protein